MNEKNNVLTIFYDTSIKDVKQLLELNKKIIILNNENDVLGLLNEYKLYREMCSDNHVLSLPIYQFIDNSFKFYGSLTNMEEITEDEVNSYHYAIFKQEWGYTCYSMTEILSMKLKNRMDDLINTNHTLRQENEVLSNDKSELKQILNSTYDEIFVTDADGNTFFVSESSKKLTGLPPEAFLGKNIKELNQKGIIANSATLKTMKTRKVQTVEQKYPNGTTVLATSQPIFNSNGTLNKIVTSSRDITELVEMKKTLDQLTAEKNRTETNNTQVFYYKGLITVNQQLLDVIQMARKVAVLDSSILISGESGVGKGILVKMIHELSLRSNKKFVQINCGAIAPSLLESELFGYVSGAFTGAAKGGKPGLVEIADGGTLFLDEVGEMPLDMQVKLLQLVQEKTFIKVGGTKEMKADIRIISATNRNLQQLIKENKFREDLYYRLHVVPLHIPPLRERKEDILILIDYFLSKFNYIHQQSITLEENSKLILQFHPFPGNVRELENLIEQIVVTATSTTVSQSDMQRYFINENIGEAQSVTLKQAIEKTERQVIKQALKFNKTTRDLAEALGVSQTTIMRKLKKYNLST